MNVKEQARRLAQLRHLRGEVNLLSQRIAELEEQAAEGEPEEPRLRQRLEDRRTACMDLLGALYAYIDDIDDSLLRQIMTYRYIYGETWQAVATSIGESDEQYPRRLHNRYLAGHPAPGMESVE